MEKRIIPDILEEHLEELAFLWIQRVEAVRSNQHVAQTFSELEERIEAHVEGFIVGGNAAIPLLEKKLNGDDQLEVFAAAFGLLRLSSELSAETFARVFPLATGDKLEKLCEASCHSAIDKVRDTLEAACLTGPPALAAAAAEVLAFHGKLDRNDVSLADYYHDGDPKIRYHAWRIVSILG